MNLTVDINADLGEGAGYDDELFEMISSANIATGFHAGDSDTMHAAISAPRSTASLLERIKFLRSRNFGARN